jgi:alpha-N-acetylglucosaminidase
LAFPTQTALVATLDTYLQFMLIRIPIFRFDLVDITRQFLVNLAPMFYHEAIDTYKKGNFLNLDMATVKFLDRVDMLDELLGSNQHFLLGQWLKLAKNVGKDNINDQLMYKFNALNQITLWGPQEQNIDYAAKQWNGLMKGYYYPRWSLFFTNLLDSQVPFNQTEFKKEFLKNVKVYPEEPTGDTIELVQLIYSGWRPLAESTGPTVINADI